jgi:hypothetical protein
MEIWNQVVVAASVRDTFPKELTNYVKQGWNQDV